MAVPLLQHEGGDTPKRIGLAHTSISPYGAFKTRDGADVLISIQNDREWRILAEHVMGDKALAADPDFASNVERMKRRPETDGRVASAFATMDIEPLVEKLARYDIAFGRINDPELLRKHPHLRRITVESPTGPSISRRRPRSTARRTFAVPALGHTPRWCARNWRQIGLSFNRPRGRQYMDIGFIGPAIWGSRWRAADRGRHTLVVTPRAMTRWLLGARRARRPRRNSRRSGRDGDGQPAVARISMKVATQGGVIHAAIKASSTCPPPARVAAEICFRAKNNIAIDCQSGGVGGATKGTLAVSFAKGRRHLVKDASRFRQGSHRRGSVWRRP